MTVLEHTLFAFGICIAVLTFLFSEWAKLDKMKHPPWQRHLYLLRPLDTIEWFMLGRNEAEPIANPEHYYQMTRFMGRILSKYEVKRK